MPKQKRLCGKSGIASPPCCGMLRSDGSFDRHLTGTIVALSWEESGSKGEWVVSCKKVAGCLFQVASVDFHFVKMGRFLAQRKEGGEVENAAHFEGEDAEGFSLRENGGSG